MLRGLQVPVMEFHYKLFQPLDIFHWSPFVLLNAISFQAPGIPVFLRTSSYLEYVQLCYSLTPLHITSGGRSSG